MKTKKTTEAGKLPNTGYLEIHRIKDYYFNGPSGYVLEVCFIMARYPLPEWMFTTTLK